MTRSHDLINDPTTVDTALTQTLVPSLGPAWSSPDGDLSLYLGDALRLLTYIPDNTIDCVWTDPPYMLSNDGITCVAGRMVSVNKGEWDRSRGLEADHEFNLEWTAQCHRVLKPTGTLWVSGTLHIYPSVGMALLSNGFRLLNDIIWEKPNPPPNLGRRTFTHSTEVVLWASKAPKGSRHKYTFNYAEMRQENGGKQMKTVWRFQSAGRDEKRFGKHPTQKPVVLIDRCLRASTNPGDIVLDPFAGTASTGVAAQRIGRRFIGIEVEQEYLDIGARRMSEFNPPPPITWRNPRHLASLWAGYSILLDRLRFHLVLVGWTDQCQGETQAQGVLWRTWSFLHWRGAGTVSVAMWTLERASALQGTG